MGKDPKEIALVSRAKRDLALATSLSDVMDIRDKAEALRMYHRQRDDAFDAQNTAAEIKVRAERRAGELIAQGQEEGTIANAGGDRKSNKSKSHDGILILNDLGITANESSRWQAEAAVPDDEFEGYIKSCQETETEITSKEVEKRGRTHKRKKKQQENHKPKTKTNLDPDQCRVINGDCLKELPKLEGVNLIFADPPYNIGIKYGTYLDKLPENEFIGWCREWITSCWNCLADDGTLWVMINDEWADQIGCLLTDIGLYRRAWIKWYETFGVNCSNNFNRTSRHLFYCVADSKKFTFNTQAITTTSTRQKIGDKRANAGGKLWDDVWKIPRVVGTSKERVPGFPTQVPLRIVRAIVGACSNDGDLVVDPFSGSGSTGVACRKLNRRFVGIEQDKEFAVKSIDRIKSV